MKPMELDLDRPLRQTLERLQERIVGRSTYFGIRTMKCPLDFWIYQEILCERRPDLIVEIGNFRGGAALALAHLCDAAGHGRVLAVDIDQSEIAPVARIHPRIRFIEADALQALPEVRDMAADADSVMVIEDSSHTYENTIAVLRGYADLVTSGQYFVVEDAICHHGVEQGPHPGPYEAIAAFLAERADFAMDRSREDFGITWNPTGYLRKV